MEPNYVVRKSILPAFTFWRVIFILPYSAADYPYM